MCIKKNKRKIYSEVQNSKPEANKLQTPFWKLNRTTSPKLANYTEKTYYIPPRGLVK